MHKKAGLVLTIIIVLLVSVACSSYKAPKYKPPQTRDAFEKPYVGTDTNSPAPSSPSAGNSGNSISADSDPEATEEAASVDDVDSLVSSVDVDEDAESANGHGTEVSKKTESSTLATVEKSSEKSSKSSAPETMSETMNLPTIVVNEGDLVKVNVKANDADGDELAFVFGPPLNSKGEWQTLKGDAGTIYAIVRVSDGKTATTGRVKIVVRATNKLPVLQHIDDITVNEGETVKLPIIVSDPDGDSLQTTIEGWMTSASRPTTYTDAGTYAVLVKVSDGHETVSQQVKVTVKDVNRPPVIEGIFGSKG